MPDLAQVSPSPAAPLSAALEGDKGAALSSSDSAAPTLRLKRGFYNHPPSFPPDAPPRLHQSIAKKIVSLSPLHGWHAAFRKQPEPFDDTRNFGSICHSLLLGGKSLVVVDAPDWRTKDARERREAALANGQLPVLSSRMEKARRLIELVVDRLWKEGLPLTGRSELTALWHRNGVWCEGTLDHLRLPPKETKNKPAIVLDFKFTGVEATLQACERRFIENGYDIQAAAYTEAVEIILPRFTGRVKVIYIFVEAEEPNAIRIVPLAGSMRTSGEWRWARARAVWKECLKKYGVTTPWPSYPDDGEAVECPPWALNRQIEEAQAETERIVL